MSFELFPPPHTEADLDLDARWEPGDLSRFSSGSMSSLLTCVPPFPPWFVLLASVQRFAVQHTNKHRTALRRPSVLGVRQKLRP